MPRTKKAPEPTPAVVEKTQAARTIWSGPLVFGLVMVPVKLYVAQDEKTVSFNMLCREHVSPVNYRKVCSFDKKELMDAEICKGYKTGTGFVIVEQSDLDKLPVDSLKTITVQAFIPMAQALDPMMHQKSYFIAPDKVGGKGYVLLEDCLKRNRKAAVVKVALRGGRERLAVITPGQYGLLLTMAYWPDEMRAGTNLPKPENVTITPEERRMADQLVESMSRDFHPEEYTDKYREALMLFVTGKAVPMLPESPKPAPDLMAALRASVEQQKKGDKQ